MSYKERSRKTIKLPSGATITIRKLAGYDFAKLGDWPLAFDRKPGNGSQSPTSDKKSFEFGVKMAKLILTDCTGPMTFEGETLCIVNKPFNDTTETELSIDELEQADAECIIDEVKRFSGMGKEAAETGRTFPEKPQAHAEHTQPGENLQKAPDGNPRTDSVGVDSQHVHL